MTERSGPIFVIGISQRCGTHYLYDLLIRHPDCRPALGRTSWEGSWEDQLLRFADLLADYADRVVASNRLNDASLRATMLRNIGAGLLDTLRTVDPDVAPDDPRRPVTKTPLTDHLELFTDLFGSASLVLLVRDPRATVASALRTFGGPAEKWLQTWRSGARRIAAFVEAHPGAAVVVRYEDLYDDPAGAMTRICSDVGLEPGRYEHAEIPVRGSSELGGRPAAINWDPVPRTDDFRPLARGDQLPAPVAARLNWLAATEMEQFGYGGPPAEPALLHAFAEHARDARHATAETVGVVTDGLHRLRANRFRRGGSERRR